MNGALGIVLEISTDNVTVKFDNIDEPYKVHRSRHRFVVLKNFYVYREQFPLTVAYAVTIHKSQGLSLDCAIIDLSNSVFGDGMAYVALSRVRSLEGVYLTSFTPGSIMASKICVEECNRLRHLFRPDLPLYNLPVGIKARKRKLAGNVCPPRKKLCSSKTAAPLKRKACLSKELPPPKKPCTGDSRVHSHETAIANVNVCSSTVDIFKTGAGKPMQQKCCYSDIVLQEVSNRTTFPFYPLDQENQLSICRLLGLNYHNKNIMTSGGLDVSLTAPNHSTLVNTVGDGSCMFRAFSLIITGVEDECSEIRQLILKHMRDNENLFVDNVYVFDPQYRSIEAYIEATGMNYNGWGSDVEMYAMAHKLKRNVYTYTLLTNSWHCFCPSKVDPTINPPLQKQGLYLYHTGNHYMVVTSVLCPAHCICARYNREM